MILQSIEEIRREAKLQALRELKQEYSKNHRILEKLEEIETIMI